MPTNRENIEKEYLNYKDRFDSIVKEIDTTLKNVAKKYYQETRFNVYIPPLRIKTLPSIIGKLERKNKEEQSLFNKDGEIMRLVTNDFIGGRILCNTEDDISAIAHIISTYPRLTIEKSDQINKNNGYSALHLDILYETYWDDHKIYIPLELQIKTHFQHAWAEITHDDDYKPEDNADIDDSIKAYYKHISEILKGLDGFLITIRKQKLKLVTPPTHLTAADTIINSKTLSFTINKWRKGEQITIQEMNILLKRLKDENFETIEDVEELLVNKELEASLKKEKEDLLINENVTAFEMIKYGSLLLKEKLPQFQEEMKSDLGFVKEQCLECGRNLTKEELEYINVKTDSDMEYYCEKHRDKHFPKDCAKCGKKTSKELCISCAADLELEKI
jgi:putative GTP pyrophosphokinase